MENYLNIVSAQYFTNQDGENTSIRIVLAGDTNKQYSVPVGAVANRHYAEIMRQVNEGTLVIQPAEEQS